MKTMIKLVVMSSLLASVSAFAVTQGSHVKNAYPVAVGRPASFAAPAAAKAVAQPARAPASVSIPFAGARPSNAKPMQRVQGAH
jgi:hypothetical protein